MFPLEEQMVAFLVSIIAGCLAAFCFDIYKTLVRYLRLRRLGLGIGDIIFWTMLAGLVFFLLLLSNGGQMRGFMLVGLALGVGVYTRVLGEHSPQIIDNTFKLISKTVSLTGKIVGWVWVCLTAPVKLVFYGVAYPFRLLAFLSRKTVSFAGRIFSRIVPSPIKNTGKKLISPVVSLKNLWRKKK